MKIKISEARELVSAVLKKHGFSGEEISACVDNAMEGELTGKVAHGLVRIVWLVKKAVEGRISFGEEEISIVKETATSLLIDGKNKTGLYVVSKALDMAFEKIKEAGVLIVGMTNTAPTTGLVGYFARKSAEQDLIFIGFNNSPSRTSGIVPYGSLKRIFGTNPITIGIPTNNIPIVLDMASSKTTVGDVLVAHKEGKRLPEGIIMGPDGEETTDPSKALAESFLGGILPIAEHKGSGLAFIVEILGGALTNSRCGHDVEGGWGSLFILIDPGIIRPVGEFKKDIDSLINEIKTAPRRVDFDEVYYPGEKSQKQKIKNIKKGEIDINDKLYDDLVALLNEK